MTNPVHPDELRVSDPERADVQGRLRRAVGAGQLDLHEFDLRVQSAWAARTRGELSRVTRDLPEPPSVPPLGGRFSDDAAGTAMRVLTIVWASVTALNVAVWALVWVTTGTFVYPWWVWWPFYPAPSSPSCTRWASAGHGLDVVPRRYGPHVATPTLTRRQVLDLRVHAQQLGRAAGDPADTAVLDLGAQDTGPDGGRWALALRGVGGAALTGDELATVWTVRGAPHLYRRADLPGVAAATAPFSDADAGKRIFDAAKPLKAAGIGNLEALDAVAAAMRSVVTAPMVKGEMSGRLTELMPAPYLRFCRPCGATHIHEMPFRLAALRAGLELEPGTSPPVLHPVRAWRPHPRSRRTWTSSAGACAC